MTPTFSYGPFLVKNDMAIKYIIEIKYILVINSNEEIRLPGGSQMQLLLRLVPSLHRKSSPSQCVRKMHPQSYHHFIIQSACTQLATLSALSRQKAFSKTILN